MIFDILAILIVIEFLKILAEDGYSTVTGRPNPRLERRRARQRSRRDNRLWGTLVDYLGDVAEDAREQAAQKRRLQRERQRQERELPEREEPRVIEPEPEPEPVRSRPRTEPVASTLDDPTTPEPEKTNPEPEKTDPEPKPAPAEATNEGTDARIIPLFPTQEGPMTTTAEATGLVSAMNHAEALNKTYQNYAAMGDTFVASLANGEVSGEAVAAAQRAREAEQLAAAEWAACHQALAEQLKVKEAYNATPGAGSKQFITNE